MTIPNIFKLIFIALMVSIIASGCQKSEVQSNEGISINFHASDPPSTVYAAPEDNKFDAVIELRNKGKYPQPDDQEYLKGKIFLSGYDENLVKFTPEFIDISRLNLYGKSELNKEGGYDTATFSGEVQLGNFKNTLEYNPNLFATLCYKSVTGISKSVCIDPDPNSDVAKGCTVGNIPLPSQNAPVIITRIDEKAHSLRTDFRITIKKVGSGRIYRYDPHAENSIIDRCNPSTAEKLMEKDENRIYIDEVLVGLRNIKCAPFEKIDEKSGTNSNKEKLQSGYVILDGSGEVSIDCELPKKDKSGYEGGSSAHITPLTIKLSYIHMVNSQKSILIHKEEASQT